MEKISNNNLSTIYKKTQRSQRKSFSTQEINRIKFRLEPLRRTSTKKIKIKINSKNKSKFTVISTNSIKPKKKLTIRIVDNSINDISNTSALENLTTKNSSKPCVRNIFNKDGLKSRNKKIHKKIFLDSSYFNTTDSNNTITPTNKTNTSSTYFFFRPHESIRTFYTKHKNGRNKTNPLFDHNSNLTIQNINKKCSELTESSTLLKNNILQYPINTNLLSLSASFKKKLEDYDEKIKKEKEKKKKDEEIINDVIDERDINNKKYNELLLLNMRSKTMRIMQEMKCIEKVTPYLAYHENDTVKRIFSFKGDKYLLDEKNKKDYKPYSVPKKKKYILLTKPLHSSKAQNLMNQTDKMLHLVNKNYKLNLKLTEKLSKLQKK